LVLVLVLVLVLPGLSFYNLPRCVLPPPPPPLLLLLLLPPLLHIGLLLQAGYPTPP
jgi:hypothetical protein